MQQNGSRVQRDAHVRNRIYDHIGVRYLDYIFPFVFFDPDRELLVEITSVIEQIDVYKCNRPVGFVILLNFGSYFLTMLQINLGDGEKIYAFRRKLMPQGF